jgi:Leucine-rich repeat (LRR) protein
MKTALTFAVVLYFSCCKAEDLSLADSMEYSRALRTVLALPATHFTFSADGSLTALDSAGGLDDGVAGSLNRFKKLRRLCFQSNDLSSQGFAKFGFLLGLEDLRVGDVTLGDDDLACLALLPKLTRLELSFAAEGGVSKLTDAAVERLAKCASLKHLSLSNSRISKKALESLQRMLPKTNIIYSED